MEAGCRYIPPPPAACWFCAVLLTVDPASAALCGGVEQLEGSPGLGCGPRVLGTCLGCFGESCGIAVDLPEIGGSKIRC